MAQHRQHLRSLSSTNAKLDDGNGYGYHGHGYGNVNKRGWLDLSEDRPNFWSWLIRFMPMGGGSPYSDEPSLWRSVSLRSFTKWSSQELALPKIPPSTVKFCALCLLWYASSALSSNTGKAILNKFRYPVTLTIVQFAFVAVYCLLFTSPIIRFTKLRSPTKVILKSTLPMGLFQVGGHMFSSMAISRIPVSTVHTIKALSPLFTVIAYAILFGVKYSTQTYMSLLPLTIGVMLACSFDISASNWLGLLCAFGSAIVFVSSNIFFKKIMPTSSNGSHGYGHKLDKLNLLLYSSSMAFVFMIPLWIHYDLPALMAPSDHVSHPVHDHGSSHGLIYNFFINGTVHFAQNIIAFIILSSVSPVTYSIASLIKRVVVICIAIVWFSQAIHPVQGFGIGMTFVGLWMYNNAKGSVEKGENKMRRVEAARDLALPSTKDELESRSTSPVPTYVSSTYGHPNTLKHGTTVAQFPSPQPLPPQRFTLHPPRQSSIALKIIPPKPSTDLPVATNSPSDSYPSPPLSHDSPPAREAPLAPSLGMVDSPRRPSRNRRSTLPHGDSRLLAPSLSYQEARGLPAIA